ncbi:MAG: hypothetical protein ACYCOU_01200 [Sulfobacillus sp.]
MPEHIAIDVLSTAKRLHTWAERLCNDTECDDDTGQCWRHVAATGARYRTPNCGKTAEPWIIQTCAEYGIKVTVEGDPRGYVCKAVMPDGRELGLDL